MTAQDNLLTVENLRVAYPTEDGWNEAVRGVSFTLGRERLGIVGESGSGKSTIGRALLRLLPRARITADTLNLSGVDLLAATEKQMLGLRGRRLSMILQDPKYSLNPVHRVGDQIAEAVLEHRRVSRREAKEATLEMLAAVKIRDPGKVYDLYPHEVSGGMGQRIMIAMMLILDPDLVVADEPTSALDVTVRVEVLKLLDTMVQSRGGGLIMISHDLNLVRHFCDRVLIMYAGRVVEHIKASELANATHPYTRGLLAAQPHIGGKRGPLPVLTRDPAWLEQLS
jgi:peptide/nickel transport system ATP-binding protein